MKGSSFFHSAKRSQVKYVNRESPVKAPDEALKTGVFWEKYFTEMHVRIKKAIFWGVKNLLGNKFKTFQKLIKVEEQKIFFKTSILLEMYKNEQILLPVSHIYSHTPLNILLPQHISE